MFSFAELLATPPTRVHEAYRKLRETGDGVHHDEQSGFHVVTRHADLRRIFRDAKTYTSDLYWQHPASTHNPDDPDQVRFVSFMQHFLLFLDGPEHTRMRNLTRHAFTPRAVAHLKAAIEVASDEILQEFDGGHEVEFVSDIAEKLPVWAIAAAMGFPMEDRDRFREWTGYLGQGLDPVVQGAQRDVALTRGLEFVDYLQDLVAHRRRNLGEDLISTLISAEEGDDWLSTDEVVTTIMVLLAAGNTTTTSLLSNGLKILMENPGQHELLVDHPDLMRPAIEEMLRLEPSLRWTARRVTAEDRIGDHPVEPDNLIFLGIAAANRDPRAFADPDRFDIERADNQHVGFGTGAHYCIGAPLARLEAAIFFPDLLKRFPAITAAGSAEYAPLFVERALHTFPVTLN